MDVFTLVGTISVEINDALANINTVIAKVGELEAMLNGTQDTTQNTAQTVNDAVVKSADDVTTKTSGTLSKWNVFLGNMATQAANKAYNMSKSFFQTGFEFNQNMEKWTAQFKTYLGGDAEAAAEFMEEVRQFAIETPLSLQESVQSAVRLMATGVDSSEVIDTLRMLGDIANGDTEKMSRLALVYSQMMAAGQMIGNDKLQLKEAGVPIFDLLDAYYESQGIESSGSQEGGASFEAIKGAFLLATQEGGMYFNAMNNIMDTEYGKAQKTMDSYEQAAGNFVNALFEVFSEETLSSLNEILEKLNDWAIENPDVLKNLAEAFSNFATDGLDVLLGSLQGLLGWWDDNRAAFDSLLVLLGGIAIYTGHPAAGTALVATGAFDAYTEAKNQMTEGSPVGQYVTKDPEIQAAVESDTTDELTGMDWFNYHVGAPLVQFMHNLFPGLTVDPSVIEGTDNENYQTPLWQLNNLDTDVDGVGGNAGSSATIGALLQQLSTLKTDVMAATKEGVAEGVSGITVTGYVTTGDVRLNEGTIVGTLAPMFNLQLGQIESQGSWG